MSASEAIINALKEFGYPCKPDIYTGKENYYFTFNTAGEHGENYGDNEPECVVCNMQIHLYLPLEKNYLKIKKQVREALFKAGFTYPEVTVLTIPEKGIRHIVYECDIEEERED